MKCDCASCHTFFISVVVNTTFCAYNTFESYLQTKEIIVKFLPSEAWNWSYGQTNDSTYLIMNLVGDNNTPYIFSTLFKKDDLCNEIAPKANQVFCVEDATLLADFQEGLYSINLLNDAQCVEIALNAVACARFARITNPVSAYFEKATHPEVVSRGQVVTLYATDGAVGDFIVLDDEPTDGVYRLMLVNDEFTIYGYTLKIGHMVRVSGDRINEFRLKHKKARYA